MTKPTLQLTALYFTGPTVNIIREDVRRRGTPNPNGKIVDTGHGVGRTHSILRNQTAI